MAVEGSGLAQMLQFYFTRSVVVMAVYRIQLHGVTCGDVPKQKDHVAHDALS